MVSDFLMPGGRLAIPDTISRLHEPGGHLIILSSKKYQPPTLIDYSTFTSHCRTKLPLPHALNKTEYGNTPLLAYLNYEAWKDTMFHEFRAVDADGTVTGENLRRSIPTARTTGMFCAARPRKDEKSTPTSPDFASIATSLPGGLQKGNG